MKYEVAYVSASGNTERLAYGIADSLPDRDTLVTDLAAEKITAKADIYLIGFGINKGMLPLKIMEVLEELHGKTILFFVTGGLEPLSEYRKAVEKRLSCFCRTTVIIADSFCVGANFPIGSWRPQRSGSLKIPRMRRRGKSY